MCQCGEVLSLILRGQTQKDCVPVWRAADSNFERTDTIDCVPVWRATDSNFEGTDTEISKRMCASVESC